MIQLPACPLCKQQDNAKCFEERGYSLLACNNCELFFISPYPVDIHQVHTLVSSYDYPEIKIISPERKYRSEVQFYGKYFPLIMRECQDAKSILDVGCGTGHFLERLSARPDLFRVGIELNSERADFARRTAGCEIHQIPIEKFSTERRFDVITMINVLSHIPDFDALFHSIRTLLSESGKLILKVGEMKRTIRKGDLFDWGIPDHLHFLGLRTVEFICSKYNFRISEHYRVPLSTDLFSADRWKAPGRSILRDSVKLVIAHIPMALPILAQVYDLTHGRRIYSSLIILSPAAE